MEAVLSLADHLQRAARQTPSAPALIAAGQSWSFARLVDDSTALAAAIDDSPTPLVLAGKNLDLARHAWACSLKNRPFWPVDRSSPPAAGKTVPADTALIISTSGSEGQPRAVCLSRANLDAASAAANQRLPLHPGDLWLACLPLYHIGGQAILWRCARAAAGVLLHDGFEVTTIAADLAGYPVTHLSLVPAMLARLLDAGIHPPPGLRHVLVGGAALAAPLYERAVAAGWPLNPSYGMSETAAQIATWTPSDGPWHEGLVGRPLAGSEIAIAADGRIRLRGPQVMAGYLDGGGPDADGWLTTGDLGRLDAAGRLSVLGRADDLLISGGRNVHPLEIESCLAACPGVADVAVSGLPDPVWGDLIVALVAGSASDDSLRRWAEQALPSAARPRRFIRLDRLPRNATGKLERAVLRRLVAEHCR